MKLQRAIQLGALHRDLGIDPDARTVYEFTLSGVSIWDLQTEVLYTVDPPNVTKYSYPVPQSLKEIINASDEELKARWRSTEGWDDVRETIFGELNFRGINILHLDLGP